MPLPARKLGSQGCEASAIGLGCMSLVPGGGFYDPEGLTEDEAVAVIHRALDLGITMFNTSDLYGPYTGETVLGKALAGRRGGVVVATKWGPMFKDGQLQADFSPANARRCCEGSLSRLQLDCIDVFILRGPVPAGVSLEETMHELKVLVNEGKIKHLGLSEVSAAQVRACHAIHPISCVELEWSLFSRDAERDIVPTLRELGIGVLAYSPLGRGLLAGRFASTADLGEKDFRRWGQPRFAGEAFEHNRQLAAKVAAIAERKGCTPAQLALAWLLAQRDDIIPIPGTKSAGRLEENAGAADVCLTPEDLAELEAAVPEGAVQGDRYAGLQHTTYHAAYSDAIERLRDFKRDHVQLQRLLAKTPTLSRKQRRSLQAYYLRQNELIDALLQTEQIHRGLFTNDAHREEAQVRRALALSFAANCLLLVVRTALALLSGSLSLVIATLDAVLDVVSSIMLYWSAHQARQRNKYQYPVGKERMEPLGIIVFSVIMGTAAFQVIVEGVKALLSGAAPDLGGKMGIVVGGTLGVVAMKLALFLYCRGSPSPAVAAFALDHLNDVLVNGVGLAGAVLGARVAAFWDPAIAIALSLWVVWTWGGQARQHLVNLVGRSAPPDLLQRLTYLAFYHDERVQKIDTVRAFTLGNSYIAEVDIVLDPLMTLREAHDIGESLQVKLELLPEVSRAYVHIDYEYTHAPEHS
ncbi:putative aldo-keto reductase 2 [Chlorella sorokiniana]|uniref:Aldo-keto reductase 2 n=1 Tax=Chlorella sorokiniana TaxID=3076 RepID=A0A2P6U0X8_CHLSO|nr:putative aldo-keto reductase 2 [Chlorella sorokiniana]|eukprot:PRW59960.1 putative aldo-keto reductase 2 [Chlorella sorokiniana]